METTPLFSATDLRAVQPLQRWEEFWQEGLAFHKTAAAAYAKRRQAFTSEILYNLIAIAIEKFVMAALMHQGTMPYNHTMKDLVEAMDESFPDGLREIREELLALDTYQYICDLEGYTLLPPEMEKIPAMLDLAGKLKIFVTASIEHDL